MSERVETAGLLFAPESFDGDAKNAPVKGDGPVAPPPSDIWLLLSRTSFGATRQESAAAAQAGYEAWLEFQLAAEQIDTAALESQIAQALPTTTQSIGQIFAAALAGGPQGLAAQQVTSAALLRQIRSPRQLYEVMVEFWTNHFNINILDGNARYFKTVDDREVIRPHALGKFGDLLRASARSVAMLFYLDNYLNVATGPNENYARELMELHTLGVGGGYTEDDVKAVARAFTGWTFNPYNPAQGQNDVAFQFIRSRHDLQPKRVLGIDMPAGRGIEDGEQVLDILISHPSTARFIAQKLVRRFVADVPPAALVDRVAAVFSASGGDIKSMLRAILTSVEFRGSADMKLKRPVEYVVSSVRQVPTTLTGNWAARLLTAIGELGQSHFQWPPPNGYPDVGGYWISAAAMLTRFNHGLGVGDGTLSGVALDLPALLGSPLPNTPAAIVDRVVAEVLRRPISTDDRSRLIAFVAAGAPITQAVAAGQINARVRELIGALIASRYFMYR